MLEKNFQGYLKEIKDNLDRGDSTEHTHRPALKTLIESLMPKIRATNEPTHVAVGAPDFNVYRDKLLIGNIECKDVNTDLRTALKTEQLTRYLRDIPNLILTDYIDFIWFRNGKEIDDAHIARPDSKGRLKLDTGALPRLEQLFENFLKEKPPEIGDPRQLAGEMARPARMIRDTIIKIFENEKEGGPLHGLLQAFKEVLLPDLDPEEPEEFADMYAQTIAYGLFAAKTEELVLDPEQFTWEQAFHHLPKSNPFLQSLFGNMMSPDNKEPRIVPWVEELAALIGRADMRTILAGFGKRTKQEDPVVHFYETFLGAYDPAMKKSRGIYYTPEPVVSYIVRSIDYLLKEKFGKKLGLADENVYILDPACGTGSFLLEVVKLIRDRIPEAAWPDYVRRKLLPRLFGFELLVAPYTIAHLKLGLYLKDTGFEFTEAERLGIYLTNTLEPEVPEIKDVLKLPFARPIAKEGEEAQSIKQEKPIMVVLGNPPYKGHSANKGEWIEGLIRDYYFVDGEPLGERNPKYLLDDYVKFLRFAQWRIEQTGHGIVGMITNHGYLDNPTFRGMRQQLMKAYSEIYVLDLHGNSKKKEVCPDGSKDENVFDIQQGVAIGLFVKLSSSSLNPNPSPEGRREPEGERGQAEGEESDFPSPSGRGIKGEGIKKPLPEELLKRCRELRKSQTPAEAKLWACLRNRQLFGAKFRRQHPVGKYIVDFYCMEAKLAIEFDGGGHTEEKQAEYDEERSRCLEAEGIKVLRFWNTDVQKNLVGVIEAIADALPLPRGEGGYHAGGRFPLHLRHTPLPHLPLTLRRLS